MNKENLNDSVKLIGDLKGNLDKLLKIQAQTISQLPPEYSDQLSFATKDINVIKKAIEAGDMTKLNELTKRYASINTER